MLACILSAAWVRSSQKILTDSRRSIPALLCLPVSSSFDLPAFYTQFFLSLSVLLCICVFLSPSCFLPPALSVCLAVSLPNSLILSLSFLLFRNPPRCPCTCLPVLFWSASLLLLPFLMFYLCIFPLHRDCRSECHKC